MVKKSDEYTAELFKIAGFSMMTPFGKVILNIPNLSMEYLRLNFILFIILSFLLLYFGIVLLLEGLSIIERGE